MLKFMKELCLQLVVNCLQKGFCCLLPSLKTRFVVGNEKSKATIELQTHEVLRYIFVLPSPELCCVAMPLLNLVTRDIEREWHHLIDISLNDLFHRNPVLCFDRKTRLKKEIAGSGI